ncbi:hypothetical protein RJ639_006277 [Escallonia herrerae]|uniref:Uncharacterized protein n=1 Tax=Escallonia herrerae TaxID=1293975 RepID=A0AA88VW27_9ASTE|nr:hypothetical protein RJ639_006277 [Escallonia herrerae]
MIGLFQKSIVKDRKALIEQDEDCSDTLIILQHHPVYTLGTASSEKNLNFDINNAPCLVMYPIVNLRYHKMDLHWYLRALEEVVIRVLSTTFSIKACRLEGLTGVWVEVVLWKGKWLWIKTEGGLIWKEGGHRSKSGFESSGKKAGGRLDEMHWVKAIRELLLSGVGERRPNDGPCGLGLPNWF